MNIRFTYHAEQQRINDRLSGLVTKDECIQAIENARLSWGENYIEVKHFEHRIYLGDPGSPDTPKGERIVAAVIVDRAGVTVKTVMLSKSGSEKLNRNLR